MLFCGRVWWMMTVGVWMWGGIRGECCKCFLAPLFPPHHQHHTAWLNQSCRWSDLARLRCETISSGLPRPPTATDPQPQPPRSLLQPRSSRRSLPRRRGKPKAPFFSPLSFSGRDSLLAGPSAANYIKFPAQRRRRKIAASAVYWQRGCTAKLDVIKLVSLCAAKLRDERSVSRRSD